MGKKTWQVKRDLFVGDNNDLWDDDDDDQEEYRPSSGYGGEGLTEAGYVMLGLAIVAGLAIVVMLLMHG